MEGTNIKYLFIMLAIILIVIGVVLTINNRPVVLKNRLVFLTSDNIKYTAKVKIYLKKYSKYNRYTVREKQRDINELIAKELKKIHSNKIKYPKFRQSIFKQHNLIKKVQKQFSVATVLIIKIKKIKIYNLRRDYSSRPTSTTQSHQREQNQSSSTPESTNTDNSTSTDSQRDFNK